MSTTHSTHGRLDGVDVARGALLVAMLIVHVVSAHATAGQATFLHTWMGIFLISSGFVALSGFVIGARVGPASRADWIRAVEAFCHLLLVMVVYGVLISLVHHELVSVAGGPESCDARLGWAPPHRFDDLGILLPIAVVQLLGPLARGRRRWMVPATVGLALGWMLLPTATSSWQGDGVGEWIVGAMARRSLTPFYTVSTFVALGLVGALLGRLPWLAVREGRASAAASASALALSVVMATPMCSRTALDPVYGRLGTLGGSAAMLLYWTIAIAALLRGLAAPIGARSLAARRYLALLGRNSLLVFIAHDFLLELNTFARVHAGVPKGAAAAAMMTLADLAVLVFVCRIVEGQWKARFLAAMLLLNRSRSPALPRPGVFTVYGGLAVSCVLAVYTSHALAHADSELVIDDFESDECPPWWIFGALPFSQAAVEPAEGHPPGRCLQVRGELGQGVHGRGLYLQRDIGDRGHLVLDVRGYGPESGCIKIELDEDDNGNWEIEKDPRTFALLYDDRFVHQLTVDWRGWRRVTVPLRAFRDDNPAVGDNCFDPARDLGSGGLLEMQLLFGPASAGDNLVQVDIDNLRWAE